ncbi:UNVERIFIED_CONTAM: putative amino-acid transport system permease protein [Brevibacillus sp. OAP136]
MKFDFAYMAEAFWDLLRYVPITVAMAIVSMAFAVVIAVLIALVQRNKTPGLLQLATVYLSFFRGTPVLVQLFIIYFGLPQLFPELNSMGALTAVIMGLSLNTSAYLAEIFRAALDSVERGQLEAAYTVGMTSIQALRRIILPQAARNAVPGMGNIFIGLLKSTSLAFTLGVTELLAEGKMLTASTLKFFEVYIDVAIIYWLLTIFYSWLQSRLENKLGKPYNL